MFSKKNNHFAMAFGAIAVACTLFLGLFIHTSAPAHAQALTTNLTITYIAVDDQNWNPKTTFNSGDQARFIIYVNNRSNFPDYVTLTASVKDGNGFTILNSNPWSVTISGNSTPGYAWPVTIPKMLHTGFSISKQQPRIAKVLQADTRLSTLLTLKP